MSLICLCGAATGETLDFTQGDRPPKSATHDWNLGPTGARGWMVNNKMETSDARQIYVTKVEASSPAAGALEKGDIILGVGGSPFTYDPRTEMGKAITAAEAGDGSLTLIRWRKGDTNNVSLQLPVMDVYSATAPYNCAKSNRIYEQGCEALAQKMKAFPNKGNPIERSLNALALLASGDPKYLPLVRQQVDLASRYSDPRRRDLHSWWYGYVNLLIAEYTLATGDRTYVPDLERITMEIVRGQSEVGSWGHRFVQPENGRIAGYGMMNSPGIPRTISLVLAREAGVSNPELDSAIEKSSRLLRFYVGKGSIPYGDHTPWLQTHDDNGKNGMAAQLFHILGDSEAAEYFSRMSVASHGGERDLGHTGNFFNMLWAMPGVSLSGPYATGAWMEEFGWYFDLARRHDGTYLHQGPPADTPDKYNGWDCTGAYLLAYSLPRRQIYLTGKKPSIIPQVDSRTAGELIADGRNWSPKRRASSYRGRDTAELAEGLNSWSPIVRLRSAQQLANRPEFPVAELIAMLNGGSMNSRLGACEALALLKGRAKSGVPALRKTLSDEDLWLRIKAAEALGAIGAPAAPAIPELLTMLSQKSTESDPRGMQQRYLCVILFSQRGGMLRRSLNGVDRDLLHKAVKAGLSNEDGAARASLASVYKNLSFQEIEPLLPSIHLAVLEPAPSGIMFADNIRLSGLELLAAHRIEEGIPLCVDLIDVERWGLRKRVSRCLKALAAYGGAARSEVPRLRKLEGLLLAKGWKPAEVNKLNIPEIIAAIDHNPAPVRKLNASDVQKDL